ncbi:hypothetical protein [Streptomyces sp. NPDC048496]
MLDIGVNGELKGLFVVTFEELDGDGLVTPELRSPQLVHSVSRQ